ncbi:MAG TPA: LysE family transporter [Thermoanaerobaculia bacterium]|nr:LysE family transporter [Thermoanaerobaculia bacterium]
MTFSHWLLFSLTETALCFTPGPAVLFVFAHGLRYGGPKSLWANAGILAANAFYFAVSATGLGMLIHASHDAFLVVKFVGAGYLVLTGIRMMLGKGEGLSPSPQPSSRDAGRGSATLLKGFVLQAANPKALVFFTAFLPQFVSPSAPIAMQLVILGVTSIVIEFFVLMGYGYLASRLALLARTPRFAKRLNVAAGAMLTVCGAGLALSKTS